MTMRPWRKTASTELELRAKGTALYYRYQFRRVITPISDAGYYVIVPDYRGAGESTKPSQDQAIFTKAIMAEDMYILLTENLKITEKVHVVGHDM